MNPELLLGVLHEKRYVDITDRLISERYPNGIESMMVQLPPHWEYKDDFFSELIERHKKTGMRIIYGDLNRKPFPEYIRPEYIRKLCEKTDGSIFKDLLLIISYQLFEAWKTLLFDGFLHAHELDKGMLKAVEIEQPQVIVVGRAHADYIKKAFPKVYYIALTSNQIDSHWTTNIAPSSRKPYKPDEVVDLDTKVN